MTNDERNPNDEIRKAKSPLSLFGLGISSLIRHSSFVISHFLPALLFSAPVCLAQKEREQPPPLDPIVAEREARALVADLLAQKPEEDSAKAGLLKIRDAKGEERELPVRVEILATATNWLSVYETLAAAGGLGPMKLTVVHTEHQPNQYLLVARGESGANTEAKRVVAHETMIPFAGSDFWLADLGLEFLHWPKQRLLAKEMRHSKSCDVLESTNPQPAPGGYARVVCWITIEGPHGIVHADAYDAANKLLKEFDPKKLEKVNGQYQLESMEMRTRKTGSRTILEFDTK